MRPHVGVLAVARGAPTDEPVQARLRADLEDARSQAATAAARFAFLCRRPSVPDEQLAESAAAVYYSVGRVLALTNRILAR